MQLQSLWYKILWNCWNFLYLIMTANEILYILSQQQSQHRTHIINMPMVQVMGHCSATIKHFWLQGVLLTVINTLQCKMYLCYIHNRNYYWGRRGDRLIWFSQIMGIPPQKEPTGVILVSFDLFASSDYNVWDDIQDSILEILYGLQIWQTGYTYDTGFLIRLYNKKCIPWENIILQY